MKTSIIYYKKLNSDTFRFDAEYYHPKYLKHENKIKEKSNQFVFLADLGLKIDASAFYPALEPYYNKGKLPFLRVADVNIQIDYDNALTIPEMILNEYSTLKTVNKGDILLTKGGSVGRVGLIERKCAVTRDLIFINSSKLNKEDYVSLFVYSLTQFYNDLLIQSSSMTAQPHLTLTLVKNIPIFFPSKNFRKIITNLFERQCKAYDLSISLFKEAEQLLLYELELINWKPKHQRSFIKNYSDTVQAERIDAEYYQPKYEKIIKTIKQYSGGWDTLEKLVTIKKCVEVGSDEYLDEGIPFVRVSNLSPFEITEEKYISETLYNEIQKHQPKKGEILFSKDATPGIAYYCNEQLNRMIPSGGILRLKKKTDKINNEYLTLVLNSDLIKEQVKRDVGGSVILHWRPDQVQKTVIPLLPGHKQTEIQKKVIESFNLRKKSKHLLECSKKAVEIAIEQDEKTAIDWLKNQVEE